MRGKPLLLTLIALLVLSAVPAVKASGVVFTIAPLNNNFSGVPGDTIIIPFQLRNLGNTTLENVTVYITGPVNGFLYQSKVIREPIAPNGTYRDTLSVKILNVAPGDYNLTLVARAGQVFSQAPVKIHVGTFVEYNLGISVGSAYPYGHNVSVVMRVTSAANGVIIGRVGYTITRDGKQVKEFVTTIYLNPGESWVKNVTLVKPPVGNYRVRLWGYFGGKSKAVTASFRVFQRHLGYRAYFQNGAIHVFVYDENGGGVPGISVRINGISFKTDDDGTVTYLVTKPDSYRVTLDLDGRIETTIVEVKRLFMSYEQMNDSLVVKVVDPTGNPVPNITVTALGPLGQDIETTNASGIAVVNLSTTGYGTILLKAESSRYIGTSTTARVRPPQTPTPTPSPTTTTGTNVTTTAPSSGGNGLTALLLILTAVIFGGTSYAAFFRPIVQEETIDRYYFVKVKAPRLKGLENFRFERGMNALEARATKGEAKIEDGVVTWEIETLEPGEEAYLQVLLG